MASFDGPLRPDLDPHLALAMGLDRPLVRSRIEPAAGVICRIVVRHTSHCLGRAAQEPRCGAIMVR